MGITYSSDQARERETREYHLELMKLRMRCLELASDNSGERGNVSFRNHSSLWI